MFTGIVEELGELRECRRLGESFGAGESRGAGESAMLVIYGPTVAADARPGDSIAVNGVCLTVVAIDGATFSADVMAETLRRSSLGQARVGDPVNLERPVTLAARLGGHLVQGHVDATAQIVSRAPGDGWEEVAVGLPGELARYVVEKGSITVDGISLTVLSLGVDRFSVGLIPTTLARTTLGHKVVGDVVNVEVDVIAKYVERMLAGGVERMLAGGVEVPASASGEAIGTPQADATTEGQA